MTVHERLKGKFIQAGEHDCWLWTAALTTSGYGHARHKGRVQQAHRIVYELFKGPIPDGLELDHLCRVRHCVNPDHLEPVTTRENILRGTNPAARHARATHCINGHELSGANLLWINSPCLKRPYRVCRSCHHAANRRSSRKYYWKHREPHADCGE